MAQKSLQGLRASVGESGVHIRCYLGPDALAASAEGVPLVFRIYRQEQPDFIFNRDYEEFFDGLDPAWADVIFEGPGELSNRRKWDFHDRTASVGGTYAYWIALIGMERPPSGPVVAKVRDRRVWWPYATVEERLTILSEGYPDLVRLEQVGRTTGNRSLLGIHIGHRERSIGLVGAIHAGESGPELIVPVLERLLESDGDLLQRVGISALLSVNVDERERLVEGHAPYLRTNSNGVDLNRNFPADWERVDDAYGFISSDRDAMTYRGPFAASESETQAVMAWMERSRSQAVFSFHCLASICSPVYLLSKAAEGDAAFQAACHALTSAYSGGYYGEGREPVLKYASSPGSLPHWCYSRHSIPCFDLEWDRDPATKGCLHDLTTPAMVAETADRHYTAIRAVLRILAAGQP